MIAAALVTGCRHATHPKYGDNIVNFRKGVCPVTHQQRKRKAHVLYKSTNSSYSFPQRPMSISFLYLTCYKRCNPDHPPGLFSPRALAAQITISCYLHLWSWQATVTIYTAAVWVPCHVKTNKTLLILWTNRAVKKKDNTPYGILKSFLKLLLWTNMKLHFLLVLEEMWSHCQGLTLKNKNFSLRM